MKIIITETQLKTVLDEATFERDHKYYKEAEQFYFDTIKALENEYILDKDNDNKTLYFKADIVNDNYKGLEIKFKEGLTKTDNASGQHHKNSLNLNVINIDIPSFYLGRRGVLKNLKTIEGKEVFIHEFIHYLDSFRYKNKEPKITTKDTSKSHNSTNVGYYFTTISDANIILRNNKFKFRPFSKDKRNLEPNNTNFYFLPITKSKENMPKYTTAVLLLDIDKFKKNNVGDVQEQILLSDSQFIPNANDYILRVDLVINQNIINQIYFSNRLNIPYNVYDNKNDLFSEKNKISVKKIQEYDKKNRKFDKKYYNSPEEFNTFYQMSVGNLINDILSGRKIISNMTFSDFLNDILYLPNNKVFDDTFLKSLTNKYNKKIIKRLYNVYKELVTHNIQPSNENITQDLISKLREIQQEADENHNVKIMLKDMKNYLKNDNEKLLELYFENDITLNNIVNYVFPKVPDLKKYLNEKDLMDKFKYEFDIWLNTQSDNTKLKKQFKK